LATASQICTVHETVYNSVVGLDLKDKFKDCFRKVIIFDMQNETENSNFNKV